MDEQDNRPLPEVVLFGAVKGRIRANLLLQVPRKELFNFLSADNLLRCDIWQPNPRFTSLRNSPIKLHDYEEGLG